MGEMKQIVIVGHGCIEDSIVVIVSSYIKSFDLVSATQNVSY